MPRPFDWVLIKNFTSTYTEIYESTQWLFIWITRMSSKIFLTHTCVWWHVDTHFSSHSCHWKCNCLFKNPHAIGAPMNLLLGKWWQQRLSPFSFLKKKKINRRRDVFLKSPSLEDGLEIYRGKNQERCFPMASSPNAVGSGKLCCSA